MPVYIMCPHCHHPAVVPAIRRGMNRVCRQCQRLFFVPDEPIAPPVPRRRRPEPVGTPRHAVLT